MRVYIVDPLKKVPEIRDVNVRDKDGRFSNAEFEKIIESEHLDYVGREVEDILFDICVDDFFATKMREVSALTSGLEIALAGTIIFTHHDDEDLFADVTDEEIKILKRNTELIKFMDKQSDTQREFLVVTNVNKPQWSKFDFGDMDVTRIQL